MQNTDTPRDLVAAGNPARAETGEWSPPVYLLVIAGLIGMGGAMVGVTGLAGIPWIGLVLVSGVAGALILWKPLLGLLLFVIFVPFEKFAVVGGTTLTRWLGLYTAICAIPHMIGRGYVELRPVALWMAIGFMAWTLLSLFVARSEEAARVGVMQRAQVVGLIFIVLNLCTTAKTARTLFITMFLATVLASLGSFVFPRQMLPTGQEMARLTIGAQDPNSFAKDLLPGFMLLPFAFGLCRRTWAKALVLLGSLIVFVGLVGTGTRSGYIALALSLPVLVLAYRPLSLPKRVAVALLALAGLMGVVIVGILLGVWSPQSWGRFLTVLDEGFAPGGRLRFWAIGIEEGLQNPVLGVGVRNSKLSTLEAFVGARTIHNDFITHFAETGLPGVLLYTGFLVATLGRLWKCTVPALRAGLVGLFTAAVLMSMANPSYGLKGFWLQMAACTVAGTVFERTSEKRSPSTAWSANQRVPRLPVMEGLR